MPRRPLPRLLAATLRCPRPTRVRAPQYLQHRARRKQYLVLPSVLPAPRTAIRVQRLASRGSR
eukprot:2645343-Rhodomonas_salina.1